MDKAVKSFEDLWCLAAGNRPCEKNIHFDRKMDPLTKISACEIKSDEPQFRFQQILLKDMKRSSRKEYLQFLNIAKGSAGEVRSLLRVANDIGYVNQDDYQQLRNSVLDLSRYLSNQIKSLRIPKQ